MATIAEMFVDIGADATEFDRETKGMQTEMKNMQGEMKTMAAAMGTSSKQMGSNWAAMSNEMKTAFKASRDSLLPFKQAQQEVQYEFFKMAQGMKNYKGTNAEFMADVLATGKKHKAATEAMMKNNDLLKMGFIQNVGTMLARSGQSEKIAANFDRMNNPLYTVNNGLLKVTGAMEGIARAGTPAVLALSMLGPTANMKELQDMTMLISRGLMRFTSVALVAGIASAGMFAALHKAAADSVPGYQEALDKMMGAVRKAFQPMVDVFGAVMIKIYEFITYIANLVNKFNEAHPVLAKVIQGFLMLIPILTLILSPLAIGIGLIAGMQAAFSAVWMLIGPLITGLGAMMGTVLLVAAAFAVVGVALWALWTKVDGFRENVIKAWQGIQAATKKAWDWIYNNAIKPAIDAVVKFVTQQMDKVKKFWDENGKQIMQAAKNVWDFISKKIIEPAMGIIMAVMSVAWPIIKNMIISTWNAIKQIIGGAIDIILGIIKTFSALFTGDWKGVWEGIKQILGGAINVLIGYLKLNLFGGMAKGLSAFGGAFKTAFQGIWNSIKSVFSTSVSGLKTVVSGGMSKITSFITGLGSTFYKAGKGLIDMMANGIKGAAGKVLREVEKIAAKARDFLPFSPAKTGPLSDLDKLDFGGPIGDSIKKGAPTIKRLMDNMLTMPGISVSDMPSYSSSALTKERAGQTVVVELDGRTIARGTLPHMEREIRLKTGLKYS